MVFMGYVTTLIFMYMYMYSVFLVKEDIYFRVRSGTLTTNFEPSTVLAARRKGCKSTILHVLGMDLFRALVMFLGVYNVLFNNVGKTLLLGLSQK